MIELGDVVIADTRHAVPTLEVSHSPTRYDRCPTVFFSAVALAATVIFWL